MSIQICKFNLLSFCPNDLFPNTKADIGPCVSRHDDYLKEQFINDPERETFEKKYQDELIMQLTKMVAQVDQKIKRSLARAENGPQGRSDPANDIQTQPEMNALQQENVNEKIDQLETKINLFNENAEKLGEEGKIDEAEAVMLEVEKFKKQKAELEALGDSSQVKKDNNMKVCEVCGALQSAGDTDKRLTMHLEGKLHTGYLKIRKKLAELRNKRQNDRRQGRRSRSRSRSPGRGYSSRRDRDRDRESDRRRGGGMEQNYGSEQIYEKSVIFSSKKLGSGANVPSSSICSIKFANMAMEQNLGYSGDFVQMGMTSLGKEWKHYKRELDKERRAAKKERERKQEAELRAKGYTTAQIRQKQRDEAAEDEFGERKRGGFGGRGGGDRRRPYGDDSRPRHEGGYRGHHR